MKKIDLDVLDRKELIRACKLIGYKNWVISLEDEERVKLEERILKKIGPSEDEWRNQYKEALRTFEVQTDFRDSEEDLRRKLYEHTCDVIRESISEMSEDERKKLTDQLDEELDRETLDTMKKAGGAGSKTAAAAKGVLTLQSGAVLLTGSNLGICILLTSGLSSLSSLIGVAFPFAAYAGAAAIGGNVLAAAGLLANPAVAVPAIAVGVAVGGYHAYTKHQQKQYVRLAGVNYLVESKKRILEAK